MKVLTTLILLFTATALFSQNYNLTLRSTLNYPGQTLANVWGIKINGKEYALVGASLGLSIVDVTDPDAPFEVTQLTDGINSLWREVKTFGNYAYMTSEGLTAGNTGGVMVANLTNLPNPVVPNFKYTGDGAITNQLHRAHALHVDTVKGYAYIYGTTGLANGGAVALNLANPYSPSYAGMYITNYIHDGYAHNDIVYGSHIYNGYFSVINFANKTSPQVLATQNTPNLFTHNTWLSADGNYLFTTDETSNSFLVAYNISNLSNIVETDRIQPTPGSGSIVHNTHIKDNFAVTSWYRDGVTIVDVGRPSNLVQIARYDTYPVGSGSGFQGAWGVYPYLPSGNLAVTNISESLPGGGTGGVLYILTPTYTPACYLEGNVKDAATNLNIFDASVEIDHTDPLNSTTTRLNGNYATGQPTPGTFNVTFSKSGYLPLTVPATLNPGQVTELNVFLSPKSLPLEWLRFEANAVGEVNVLHWSTASEQNTLRHEVQARSNRGEPWQTIGQVPAAGNSGSEMDYEFTDPEPAPLTYYRIKTLDLDGQEHFSPVVSVERPRRNFGIANVYPVPTAGIVRVEIHSDRYTSAILRMFNLAGQVLLEENPFELSEGTNLRTFDLPQQWPDGKYFIEIIAGNSRDRASLLLVR